MSKPAARKGDMHECPKVTPGTPPVPHVGGPVYEGCHTVLIEGVAAARVGDLCICCGEQDVITTGSSSVYIGGKPAACKGDQTAHGGKIVVGSKSVMIGGRKMPRILKQRIINEAIEKCIVLLEEKLQLLEQNDSGTLIAFKKWFGCDDEKAKGIILERIRKVMEVSKMLSVDNFKEMIDRKSKTKYAQIYPDDKLLKLFIGEKFWTAPVKGKDSRSGVLVHELSHVDEIGNTFDYVLGVNDCLVLAKNDPSEALYNADSFEYFIEI